MSSSDVVSMSMCMRMSLSLSMSVSVSMSVDVDVFFFGSVFQQLSNDWLRERERRPQDLL